MSHDAQHRAPEPMACISEMISARLNRLGFSFSGQVMACEDCGPMSQLHFDFDLINGDWKLSCSRCGQTSLRSYTDPIRAILFWNAEQTDRQHRPPRLARSSTRSAAR